MTKKKHHLHDKKSTMIENKIVDQEGHKIPLTYLQHIKANLTTTKKKIKFAIIHNKLKR